jgi:O-antigen ligase
MRDWRVETRPAEGGRTTFQADLTADRRRAETSVLAVAVGVAAVLLPFVVVPAWYDAYYWPKVCVLYAAVAAGAVSLLRAEGTAWLRSVPAPLGKAFAAWLAALAVATALSVDRLLSLVGEDYRYEGLLTWAAYGALAAISAAALRSPARLRVILAGILAGAGVMSAVALLQHLGFSPVPIDAVRRGWVRAWGTTGSPLALGAYAVLLLPLTLGLYADSRRGLRALYGALAVVLYAALIATEARAEWGALGVGLLAWGAAAGRATMRRAARALLVMAALLAAVTPAVMFSGAPLAAHHVRDLNSGASRVFIWRTSAPLVAKRPLFGWGPETLARIYPAYGTPEFVRVFPEAAMQHIVVDRPHNDLLQQTISAGIAGLAVYLWLWWALLQLAWGTARASARGDHGLRRGDDQISSLVDPPVIAAGLFGGFAAYLAQMQLSFSYVSVAPLFWVLVGAAAALRPRVAWASRLYAVSGSGVRV